MGINAMNSRSYRAQSVTHTLPSQLPSLPSNASLGKRWRLRRNLVIFIAYRNGVSQRLLADVFDLPRSRIASIIKEFATCQSDHS